MDIVYRRFTSLVARKGNLDLARTKIRIEYPMDIVWHIFGLWREKNLFRKYQSAEEKGEIRSHRSDLSSILLFRTEIDSNLWILLSGEQARGTINRAKAILTSGCGALWPNFSPIPDLVKYLRTQSLVSVASLNVQRYMARWLERLRPLSPMKQVKRVKRGRLRKAEP